jgi:hypothetical protein
MRRTWVLARGGQCDQCGRNPLTIHEVVAITKMALEIAEVIDDIKRS